MSAARVEVERGGVVESVHRFHVAVAGEDGRLVQGAGDVSLLTFARSAIKAIQAMPLVEDGVVERYGLTEAELALCCASHAGEPFHVEAARSILAKIGADEDALACGPQRPTHRPSADAILREGGEYGRIHNNCSGKHAGMLALARAHGWPLEGYHTADHPVQQRMRSEVSWWTGIAPGQMATGIDGCGVLTFQVPLHALASAFARLARGAWTGERGPAEIFAAMARHPEYVAGTDRLCTDVMRVTGGRIIAKFGAEGVYCAAVPEQGLGIAIKVEDGARRAVDSALVGTLRALGLLSEAEYGALQRHGEPAILNTRGEEVGRVRPVVRLERHGD